MQSKLDVLIDAPLGQITPHGRGMAEEGDRVACEPTRSSMAAPIGGPGMKTLREALPDATDEHADELAQRFRRASPTCRSPGTS